MSDRFAEAQEQVKSLTSRPSNEQLLELYALFKQGSVGDVSGSRPGMMDFKGRAKYDAWAKVQGMEQAAAQEAYVALVDKLIQAN
ncbi:MAG: acyl-CoA-binding protein [Myxococcota bacterium]